jgi:hypothetical protein
VGLSDRILRFLKGLQPGKVPPRPRGVRRWQFAPRPADASWRRGAPKSGNLGRREAVIAVEFARQPDQPVHRLKIAVHHHRARDDHRFVDPGDLQLDEAGGRIDLAARQHFLDDAPNAPHTEPLLARDMRHREPRRQSLQNAQPPLGRRAARHGAGCGLRRRRRGSLAAVGFFGSVGHDRLRVGR